MNIIKTSHIELDDERSLKSYVGIDYKTYYVLLKEFELSEKARMSNLADRAGRKRKAGGGGKSFLLTAADKLLFILHYYKTYPTMDVLATHYGVSRASIWNHVHNLSAVLHRILVKLKVMPLRELPSVEEFKAYIEALNMPQLIIDVTERPIERPKDKAENKAQYSGKKNGTPSKIRLLPTSNV